VDGKFSTTLHGDAIAAEFEKILDDYVESHYGLKKQNSEMVRER
jgi:hypothetical protein